MPCGRFGWNVINRLEARRVMNVTKMRGVVLGAALLVVGCGQGDAMAQEGQQDQAMQDLREVPTTVDTSTAASLSRTFRAAAATALPSVVTVQVTAQPQSPRQQSPFPFPFGRPPQGQPQPQMGTGSGFVFTDQGHIITNNHVVESATNLQIRFPDGRIYDDVEVIGRDPNSDIAVVRINSDRGDFAPLRIGDSDRLQVGDWVLALGNPLNLGFTVTAGIVSAKGRNLGIIQGETALESFIQTDAAINRGNSGGPLVDLYGRLVGVNTAIYSPTGSYAGNGFAVPAAIAVDVARDLIEYGHVRRPQLGVRIQPVTEAQAEMYQLDRIAGAFVSEVSPGGPAEEAGIQPEDIIISLNGQSLRDSGELISRLAREEPGDEVTLGIVRNGRRIEIEAELGEFDVERPETQVSQLGASPEELLGLELTDATPQLLRRLQIEEAVEGVVVAGVSPYGPTAGQLQQGDIILELNRQPVRSVREFQRLASDLETGDVVAVRIRSVASGNEAVRTFRIR